MYNVCFERRSADDEEAEKAAVKRARCKQAVS